MKPILRGFRRLRVQQAANQDQRLPSFILFMFFPLSLKSFPMMPRTFPSPALAPSGLAQTGIRVMRFDREVVHSEREKNGKMVSLANVNVFFFPG